MSENNTLVVGNVTHQPELKFLNGGAAALRLSIAVNRRWQNRQTQEWEEKVSFLVVTAYGALAENVANSVDKGTRVVVSGRTEQRSWVADGGATHSAVEIVADEISPSLRWATAVVTKTPRAETAPARFPSEQRPGAPARPTVAAGAYAYDEEPF